MRIKLLMLETQKRQEREKPNDVSGFLLCHQKVISLTHLVQMNKLEIGFMPQFEAGKSGSQYQLMALKGGGAESNLLAR